MNADLIRVICEIRGLFDLRYEIAVLVSNSLLITAI
jgi:hypothetical protein